MAGCFFMANSLNNKQQTTNSKIVFFILLPIAVCCSLFFIPTVRAFILALIEKVVLHRELREKYIWDLRLLRYNLLFFILLIFSGSLLLFTDINIKKVHISPVMLFSLIVFGSFCLSNIFLLYHPEETCGYWADFNYSDIFISLKHASNSTYDGVYPPLATIFYHLLIKLFPNVELPVDDFTVFTYSFEGCYVLMLFYLFSIIPLVVMCYNYIQGTVKEKTFFCLAIIATSPVIFAIQRGNMVLLALELTMFFYFSYTSKDKVIRELGLWSLAIAAAIKLYPAIFGLLLLKNRQWKEAFKCVLYGLILLFVPMLFFNDQNVILLMINNLTTNSGNSTWYSLSLKFVLKIFYSSFFNTDSQYFNLLYYPILLVYILLSAFLFIFSSKKWHLSFICVLFCISLPEISWPYTSIFFIIPLIELLNSKKDKFDILSFAFLICHMVYFRSYIPIIKYVFTPFSWWFIFGIFFISFIDVYIQNRKAKMPVK